MPTLVLLIIGLIAAAAAAYVAGRRDALAASDGSMRVLHSLPGYHGAYLAIWCCVPALLFVGVWSAAASWIVSLLVARGISETNARFVWEIGAWSGAAVALVSGYLHARRRSGVSHAARDAVERFIKILLMASSTVAILTTIGIVLSLIVEAGRFFTLVSPVEFFFGLQWSPQTALRADQVGSSGSFGAIPVFLGTFIVMLIAMGVAVPIGLMAAIYLSEYAGRRTRALLKPALELLAGIPTVVYGFFAALTIGPAIRTLGESLGLNVASESALAAGSVMGVMIIPFVSSLSDDVIRAVPVSLRDAGLALGATRSETVRQILLPAALPGIAGAILLAISRAIGETMIVVMAAGLSARLTANPFEAVTTVTVQIVSLLVGDQEFDSAKTLAAFALGLVLFTVTLVLNVIALHIVRTYREKYD
jgi:phosphate transport system permease protein